MTDKKIISLKQNELVSLVESVVMDVREQTSAETKKHKNIILQTFLGSIFGPIGASRIAPLADYYLDDGVEEQTDPKAGEMEFDLVLEDSIWDKIWYGTRDVLGWVALVSVIPHPITRIVGLVAGGLAGAMYMVDDEWGTGVAYWIFEALPYVKLGKFLKVKVPKWAKLNGLKPREVRRAMEGIARGGDISKIKGAHKVQQLLVREGPELIETYTKALNSTNYKTIKKLTAELTTEKAYKQYLKSGKYGSKLKGIPWSKWEEVIRIVKATGPMELKGLKLLYARAASISHTATIGLTYYTIATLAQKITDIESVKFRINNTLNPWESAKQGKKVYYDYHDIMLDNIEFLYENPVLLIKAWNDGDQFPPINMVPVDVTINGEDYWGMGPDGKDSEYYFNNDNYDSLWGPGAGQEELKNPEKPYNTITMPVSGGGWRPELGIWDPEDYDLRYMDKYFRESLEAIKSVFVLLEKDEISEKEAQERVEEILNVDLD